jgi:PAS domain S-box-containing protein
MTDSYPSKPDFQTLFEAAPGLYLVLLPDAPRYTIVAVSNAYARATLTTREHILGRGFFDVFPGNPADPIAPGVTDLRASLERVLTTRAPDAMTVQKYDIRRPAESGGAFEERWWNLKNSPVFGPRGEVACIIHAVEDVTQTHRLEEERQLFAALVENSSDFIGIADPSGKPVYVNPAGRRMVGLAPDHPVSDTQIPEYYPPEDRAFAADVIVKEMVEHGHWSGETHFRHWKTGEAIPVSDEHFLIRHPGSGRLLGMGTITRDISEVRRAAAERERSLALANELFDQASDSIFIADLDGRFTQVNATACQMLGYAREELIGRTIADIIPPEDVPRLAATREHLLSPGTVHVAEWTQVRKDGTRIPVEVSSKILPDGRWQAFVRDISERKRIEEELRGVNASLDAIIDNIPLMLFLKENQSLRFVRFNRAGEDLLGWPRQGMIGKNDYDLWPQAQADFFVQKDRETLNSGTIVDIPEEPIQTRHQGVRFLHTKKVPILDAAGHPLYLLGISEDITERRRSEKEQRFLAEAGVALSASLDFEQTMATVAQMAVQHIADWCAVDVMDERERLSRLKVANADPTQAALCAALEQMPPNRDLPHFVRSVSEGGRPILVEHVTSEWVESFAQTPEHLQAVLATGVLSLIAVPLVMRGRPLGVVVLGSSAPSRVYGPGDLRLAEALADRAAVAIENARLYRASVRATQLRDQVLGVVAHDLRSPLSAILLQASLLKRRGPDPERRSQKPREAIHQAGMHMNRLIQDLLDIAVIEAGQLTIKRARLSARDLIVEATDMQRPLASSSSLALRVDVDSDVPEVWGDRDRLVQVFQNLIGNAIKFTKPGGDVTVGAAAGNREVVFRVADTGCGIAPESVPHVFDRFWQANSAGRQGAGLGLPIAKGIVEAHGGRIWVETTEGRGATFSFTIPTASLAQDVPSDGLDHVS